MVIRQQRWAGLALLMILLLAAALRFWRLGEMPPGLYHDEAYNGLDALSLLDGKEFPQFYEGWELYAQDAHAERPPNFTRTPIFFEGNYGREPLHVYLMALSIAIAGATPFAVRAVPAAAGVLAVLTTFLAAWALFPKPTHPRLSPWLLPLLAAFTMAVLYPAVHFSRFGIRAMLFVPCATLAVMAFWIAFRATGGRSWVWYAVAGFFLGLGLYTYAAARLLPLLFIGFGFFLLLLDRAALRAHLLEFGLMGGVALLTALPLLLFFARYPYYFAFRLAYVANRGAGTVADAPALTWLLNVGRVVGGFFWQGETHLRHNLPGRPFLDPVQRLLAVAGLGVAFWRWRKPESAFLLLWLGVMLLPSILSGDAPHFGRLIGAAPPAAIVLAVGASALLGWVLDRAPASRWLAPLLLTLAFLPSLVWTARDYFVVYANHPDLARDFYLAEWQMGQLAAEQPPETALYLTPTQEEMATIYFALRDPDRLRSFSEGATLAPAGFADRPILYFIRPGQDATIANLAGLFPTASPGPAADGYTPLAVTPDDARNWPIWPAPATMGPTIQIAGAEVSRSEGALAITLVWQALAEETRDLTMFVHLEDGSGTVVAQTDRPPAGYPTTEWRPGELVVDRVTVPLPAGLAPGTYRVTTGFYYLPTLARTGDPVLLGTIEIK
jgi:4-amino-4-deoxy-L-arabinose transferase-like glycosyltransferase